MKRIFALLALLGTLALSGCSNYHAAYVPTAQVQPEAAAICVDNTGLRVPDNYCPIGDGTAGIPSNYHYGWDYYPYSSTSTAVVVPYVGYRVPNTWTRTRPVNVTTININRGSFPTAPTAGMAPGAAASVPLSNGKVAGSSSNIQRGGLGVGATTVRSNTTSIYTAPPPGPVKRAVAAVKQVFRGKK